MSSFKKFAEEEKLPAYFVAVMLRMGFVTTEEFARIDSRRRDQILAAFAGQLKCIAADRKDSFHNIVKQYCVELFGSFKFKSYVSPLAVRMLLDGKLFKN